MVFEPKRRIQVAVLVATSSGRTHWLVDRCLPSIYRQAGVDLRRVQIIVVDDNADRGEHARIATSLVYLRERLGLALDCFPTTLLRNARTVGHSGTGAWNTGLDWLRMSPQPPEWIALLDDDDEYLERHIERCLWAVEDEVAGVFERLEWIRDSGVEPRPFTEDDLTPEAFFIGNPGVQGSNLFLRRTALDAIGGFDETLCSATDRDLMIRFLHHARAAALEIRALPSVGVRYYDHAAPRVNTNLMSKRQGLDRFYAKHASDFQDAALVASLERARQLFAYERAP